MALQSEVKPERLVEIGLIFAVLHRLPCHQCKIALEAQFALQQEKLYLQKMDKDKRELGAEDNQMEELERDKRELNIEVAAAAAAF